MSNENESREYEGTEQLTKEEVLIQEFMFSMGLKLQAHEMMA